MVLLVSNTAGWLYHNGIKPLLFRFPPDSVHHNLVRIGGGLQRLPGFSGLVRWCLAYRSPLLKQTIDGVTFENPVGLSAGFDKDIQLVPTMRAVGFGFMTGGSVSYQPCDGNPHPWFYRLPAAKALIVHAGLPNQGVRRIVRHIRSYRPGIFTGFPLVVSVAKTNSRQTCGDSRAIADYTGSLLVLAAESAVAVLEINISCPNTYGGEPFTTPRRLEALLTAVDTLNITKPIWIKMPINLPWPDFDALLTVILRHRVNGVTIGNLNKDRSAVDTALLPQNVKGNLSGQPTQALSDNLIAHTYQAYGGQLTIIGVGGIFSAQDAYRKIRLGANLVGIITGLVYGGPQVTGRINRDLARLLKQDGYRSVSEAIGTLQPGNTSGGTAEI